MSKYYTKVILYFIHVHIITVIIIMKIIKMFLFDQFEFSERPI